MSNQVRIKQGVDWSIVWLYILLVAIGLVSIFLVTYDQKDNITESLIKGTTFYGKQIRWIAICAVLAIFVLLADSKLFTATANLQYAFGILLILITFFFHAKSKGSNSFLGYGNVKFFQPAEFAKLFTLLALAKFLSKADMDFSIKKNHLIASAIILVPCVLTILQNETGLALVYIALFIAIYREGFPLFYITITVAFAALVIITLLANKNLFSGILLGIGNAILFFLRKKHKRNRGFLFKVIFFTISAILIQRIGVAFLFTKVLKPHQTSRIYNSLGIDDPFNKETIEESKESKEIKSKADEYNVRQSKIAIGSGGFIGKGFLDNTQARYFVPVKHTDFIFCTIGESFGFVGSFILLAIYLTLLWRITIIAERQRSTFSRVYAYGVASIIFFHIFVNMAMTLGLAPVIGIPLPYLSYGGTSLITFTVLLFILVRLDADRQMVLR